MTTTPNLPEADLSMNQASFKTKAVAFRRAKEWAGLNSLVDPDHKPEVGEVFEVTYWNGGYNIPAWLQYTVSVTDEGYTITSHRWLSDPRKA